MRTLLLSAFLLLPALLQAQESRPVRCRFLTFGRAGADTSAIAQSEKGGDVTCPLSSFQLSNPIVCVAKANAIPFISPSDRKPLATATIPPGVSAVLLVFIQLPKAPDAPADATNWRIMVIEDSPKNFPDGGVFIANFNGSDIRFIIGEHKGQLPPGGSQGYAMPTERDSFNMATVNVEVTKNGRWRNANESALRFLPGMRYLIFAYADPVSGRPRINTYQDIPTSAPRRPAP
jgi:hypothetical protein